MSILQAGEESVLYADFLSRYTGQELEEIVWGPSYSTGTRVFARTNGVWRAFLVSDLTAPTRPFSFTIGLSARTTLSLTNVSTGYGFSITPKTTGRIFLIFTCLYKTDTIGDGVGIAIYKNTTGVPPNGTAVGADTQVASQTISVIADANLHNFCLLAVDTTATNGTTWFYYIAFDAITGGTAAISSVRPVGWETPS